LFIWFLDFSHFLNLNSAFFPCHGRNVGLRRKINTKSEIIQAPNMPSRVATVTNYEEALTVGQIIFEAVQACSQAGPKALAADLLLLHPAIAPTVDAERGWDKTDALDITGLVAGVTAWITNQECLVLNLPDESRIGPETRSVRVPCPSRVGFFKHSQAAVGIAYAVGISVGALRPHETYDKSPLEKRLSRVRPVVAAASAFLTLPITDFLPNNLPPMRVLESLIAARGPLPIWASYASARICGRFTAPNSLASDICKAVEQVTENAARAALDDAAIGLSMTDKLRSPEAELLLASEIIAYREIYARVNEMTRGAVQLFGLLETSQAELNRVRTHCQHLVGLGLLSKTNARDSFSLQVLNRRMEKLDPRVRRNVQSWYSSMTTSALQFRHNQYTGSTPTSSVTGAQDNSVSRTQIIATADNSARQRNNKRAKDYEVEDVERPDSDYE
jgi:hypothetical protein